MRRPIVSKSERSGTGVDMANLSKAVCHGESDKRRFGNPPQESNFQRLGITGSSGRCCEVEAGDGPEAWRSRSYASSFFDDGEARLAARRLDGATPARDARMEVRLIVSICLAARSPERNAPWTVP